MNAPIDDLPKPAPKPALGAFITLEGGEGAGKSTQAHRLVERLQESGIAAIATREPGGSPGAEALREILLSGAVKELGPAAEAMLFSAARIDHIDKTIEPALAAGSWVICDRFMDSTRAYQGSLGNVGSGFLQALERVSLGTVFPDLTLMLDLPPEVGLARAGQRRGVGVEPDRFEGEGLNFHARLRQAFLDIAEQEPGRCAVIDATAEPDEVSTAIWNVVSARLADWFPSVTRV